MTGGKITEKERNRKGNALENPGKSHANHVSKFELQKHKIGVRDFHISPKWAASCEGKMR